MGHVRYGIVNTIAIVALAIVWLVVAPRPLGGLNTYAIVSGISMNPLLHRGDVVVLRNTQSPEVGDVVAYYSEQLRTIVVHRIVAEENGLFTFKGDNNEWLDTEQVAGADVLGKMWFKVSGAGDALAAIREPWRLGVLTGGLVLFVGLLSAAGGSRVKVANSAFKRGAGSFLRTQMGSALTPTGQVVLGVTIVLAFVSAVMTVYSWISPTHEFKPVSVAFAHHGAFDFHAPPALPQISDIPVGNGDPIFVNLTPDLSTTFNYSFTTDGDASDLRGTIDVYGVLSNLNGWHQVVGRGTRVSFEGSKAEVAAQWHLPDIMQVLATVEEETKSSMRYYTAALVADVHLMGTVDGRPVDETFAPLFHFRFNPPNEIFVETSATRIFEGVIGVSGRPADEFRQQQHGAVETLVLGEKAISYRSIRVMIWPLRWTSTALFTAFSLAIAVFLVLGMLARRQGEDFLISARFGGRIVETMETDLSQETRSIRRVRRFEDLVHLSDVLGRLILCTRALKGSVYSVDGADNVIYTYQVNSGEVN